jgi:hypothetical protein
MRWRLDLQCWAVVGLGLLSACVTYDQGAQAVVDRMAQEYNCPGEMAVTSYAAGGYRVTGCGYTANYDCSYGRNGSVTCVKEAGSSPVPDSLPAPPLVGDAGTK